MDEGAGKHSTARYGALANAQLLQALRESRQLSVLQRSGEAPSGNAQIDGQIERLPMVLEELRAEIQWRGSEGV